MASIEEARWGVTAVTSPHITHPVEVIAIRDVQYVPKGHRFQTLSIYLPKTAETTTLVGTPLQHIPFKSGPPNAPRWHIHVHGGAWRDPQLTSASIEADAAHAFSDPSYPITAIISINYTLSPFPTHPTLPYDPIKAKHSEPSREATHPRHLHDVLLALGLLRSLGLADDSYILSGHSAGACLVLQSVLVPPRHHGLDVPAPPRPAALLGMNGLYDLGALVHGLGDTHAGLKAVYADLLGIAFGADEEAWRVASPAKFPGEEVAVGWRDGRVPRLVVLDQSEEDQLVPVNQVERMEGSLGGVEGLRVVRGRRCTGRHAAPWEEGIMIWESVVDILRLLEEGKR